MVMYHLTRSYMSTPYIKLTQINIDPAVIQEIIDISWDGLTEPERKNIIGLLQDYGVEFDEVE